MRGGVFVLEFKNLRPGRAIHFFKKVATKLPTPTKIQFQASKYIQLSGIRSCNPFVKAYY